MRNTKKAILAGVGATLLGLVYLQSKSEFQDPSKEKQEMQKFREPDPLKTETQSITQREIIATAKTLNLEKKYMLHNIQGTVYRRNNPLEGVEVSATIARITGITGNSLITQTDAQGQFSIPVPEYIPYDITAQIKNRVKIAKTIIPDKPTAIIFEDSPDVTVVLKEGVPIRRAILQSNDRTLEGIIQANQAQFPDVESRPYNLIITTESAVVNDEVPVFDEDIRREYTIPESIFVVGSVIDKQHGRTVPNATVTLTLPEVDTQYFKEVMTTNEQGKFTGRLAKISYNAEIKAEGYRKTIVKNIQPNSNKSLELEIRTGATIKGKVLAENNEPVANSLVYMLEPLGMEQHKDLHPVKTNEHGEFILTSVDPETPLWKMPGPQAYVPIAVKQKYHQPRLDTIIFEKNEAGEYKEREIVLRVAKNTCTLEGRVLDLTSNPVQTLIEIRPVTMKGDERNISNTPFYFKEKLETNPEGVFRIEQLPPGVYDITAQPIKEGYLKTTIRSEIPSNKGIEFILSRGVSLEGKAILQKDGSGISGANILFTTQTNPPTDTFTTTDSGGNFKVYLPEEKTKYSAWKMNAEGTIEEEKGVIDLRGINSYLPVLFTNKPHIQIKVRDLDTQEPVQSYFITALEKRENGSYATQRNGFSKDGSTQFPIQYPSQISITAPSYENSRTFSIAKIENQNLEIEMKKKK